MSAWNAHPKRFAIALSIAMFAIPLGLVLVVPHPLEQPFGVDFVLYRDAAARWLAGGPYFEPYQLTGPYPITAGDVLYPPVALWLFVPFTILPAVPWWVVPIGVTAWGWAGCARRLRGGQRSRSASRGQRPCSSCGPATRSSGA